MSSLTRGGLQSGLLGKATIEFGAVDCDLPVELTIDTRGPGVGFLELAHEERTVSREPISVRYRVWLAMTRPNFGGRRYWFVCQGMPRRRSMPRLA